MSVAERSRGLRSARVDYGLDAPGIVATFAALCAVLTIAGVVLLMRMSGARAHRFGSMALWMGTAWGLTALLMVLSSRVDKLRARDRLLDRLALRGDETLLDVGCGHGLLLLGAAKRLTTGRAVGVDLWSQRDQSSNSAEATLANADAERVRDRVEVRDGDMRALPLPDASVDVVVSSLAIHNLSSAADRARALAEIVRVLRPNGRIALLDIAHVGEYARVLREHGCTIERSAIVPTIFPPTRELHARRGAAPRSDPAWLEGGPHGAEAQPHH
jgi:ubiquinone/menaquinone biosynthesis C-methylase UbiE